MSGDPRSITCGMCFRALSKPLTFDCTHSFCTECVRKQLTENRDNGFICPMCTAPFMDVRANNLAQFANRELEAYIAGLSEGKFGQAVCQWCETAPSSLQCGECMATYCGECCEAAHKRPSKRNHVITKLNESSRTFYRRCHQYSHEEYRAEFYCEECGEVCCAYCLQVGPHKDHANTSVAKAAAEARQRMTKDMQWLSQSKAKLETQTTELNRVTVTYRQTYDQVEEVVSQRFALFKQQLAQRELETRKSLSQLRESGDSALSTARRQFLAQLNAVNEGLLRMRGLQSGGADYDVLQNKALLDACVHNELPTITGTGFNVVEPGELELTGVNVQLDLQTAEMLRRAGANGVGESSTYGVEETAAPYYGTDRNGGRGEHGALTTRRGSGGAGAALTRPLRLTFPVDEDVEATVRPNGVYLRCIARGTGSVQIGVRSKEMLENIIRAHPEDGGVVTWQVQLENVSDTFLGIVEKTGRSATPEGFYWKPACSGVVDGHLGRQQPVARQLPVCRNGDTVRFVYDANAMTLSVIVNDTYDCGVIVSELHPKVAACFIFYPGEAITVLF